MVLEIARHLLLEGPPQWVKDNAWLIVKVVTTIAIIILIKLWGNGKANLAERKMHGKVIMVTGGTSGIGASVVHDLASRGAQVILLTQTPINDAFLAEYIKDVREQTRNQMVYAEQVDMSSLHSIRKFATKWIDNAPPRRLDMIILNAATITPPGHARKETEEGIEETWMINYLANFHLLGILSPALRAQPFDRDVRVIITTCASYIGAPSLSTELDKKNWTPGTAYRQSKLALMSFGYAFQKHLDAYKRPDDLPMNARVIFVDPGFVRSPGMRRWLTRGSLWGLFLYMIAYFVPWLFLKSPEKGAQSILHASMDADLGRGPGGRLIKECQEVDFARKEVLDDEVARKLWEDSDQLIERVEKKQAQIRARNKQSTGKGAEAEKPAPAKSKPAEKAKPAPKPKPSPQAAAPPDAQGPGPQPGGPAVVSDAEAERRLKEIEDLIESVEGKAAVKEKETPPQIEGKPKNKGEKKRSKKA